MVKAWSSIFVLIVPLFLKPILTSALELENSKNSTSIDKLCNGEIGQILQQIRNLMRDTNVLQRSPIQAYIIPIIDAHQNEFVADHDKRLQYISKFTGLVGEAVITMKDAVLWTDSTHSPQAEKQLDRKCWTLMKSGELDVPDMDGWLLENLSENSTVGIDPFLIADNKFREKQTYLQNKSIELVGIEKNLIDIVWKNRPKMKRNAIYPLDIKYTGMKSGSKIAAVLDSVSDFGVESVVVTNLDDIAWLLNLRGSDDEYSPVFFSYVIISRQSLYFFVDEQRLTTEAKEQLKAEGVNHLIIRNYEQILNGVKEIIDKTEGPLVVPSNVNTAIGQTIPRERHFVLDIVSELKAVKNRVEAENMERAHIRDGLAVIQYLHWLNSNIDKINITELSGAEKLAEFRATQENFRGLSFETISAVGGHAAFYHYKPTKETDKRITRDEIYLLDSGAQYLDGTTDITRTVHFGKPKIEEKINYTRVLKGFITLMTSIFPYETPLRYFDDIARRALWQGGLDYKHATGHGIGMFLFVHEKPPALYNEADISETIKENMFVSNEPGYYKDNEYGIRIEDIMQVIKTNISNAFEGSGALTFRSITYVPIFTKLIVTNMLTKEEANYVNAYNRRVMDAIGPLLIERKHFRTFFWLRRQTRKIYTFPKNFINKFLKDH